MQENRKKRGGASAAVLLALLIVIYPLSSGPAVMVLGATGPHPAAVFAFKVIYAPLALLTTVSPKPCEDAAERWGVYCDRYAVF